MHALNGALRKCQGAEFDPLWNFRVCVASMNGSSQIHEWYDFVQLLLKAIKHFGVDDLELHILTAIVVEGGELCRVIVRLPYYSSTSSLLSAYSLLHPFQKR